jgi:UDP-N-acetylglucosamine 2-epimerase (non-hydrolysing)
LRPACVAAPGANVVIGGTMEGDILFVFGTRPEAIKMCPVVGYMRTHTDARVRVCTTAQHRDMLDQVLSVFNVTADYDLGTMRHGQTLGQLTVRILADLEPVLNRDRPSMVVVQGDTTTTFAGALAAFYARVPVAHIEAGLRTGDPRQPFPEEMNRVLVTRLSQLHFAATTWAAGNLCREGVDPHALCITGNTGIDALLDVSARLASGEIRSSREWQMLDTRKKLIVVTAHRRESFGSGVDQICDALSALARCNDVQIVYPVHPNPSISSPVRERLQGHENIVLTEPLDYISFVDLMRRAWVVLTDSGGIQEEAPSLGKPVLVMRDKTERPEAVEAGTAMLVGLDASRIFSAVQSLIDSPAEYHRRSLIHNPYGDGKASERISAALQRAIQRVPQ